jgi:hypothetical protein
VRPERVKLLSTSATVQPSTYSMARNGAPGLAEVEDLDEAVVLQREADPRLVDEEGGVAARPAVLRAHDLEGHQPVGAHGERGPREEDLGRAAGAQAHQDLVPAEAVEGAQGAGPRVRGRRAQLARRVAVDVRVRLGRERGGERGRGRGRRRMAHELGDEPLLPEQDAARSPPPRPPGPFRSRAPASGSPVRGPPAGWRWG